MRRTTMAGEAKRSGRLMGAAALLLSGTALALACAGCASADVDVMARPQTTAPLVQPDYVLVYDLAVTPDDVKTDRGLAAQAVNEMRGQPQTAEEIRVGRKAAMAFTDALVEDLRKAGIRAGRARDGYKPTAKTLVISGKFTQVDQGNQTMRVWVGFGLGGGEIRALIDGSQGDRVIARAQIKTTGSFKPGLLVPVAGGAAAGTAITSSAVAAGGTGISEGLTATIEADANRAARAVAKRIVQGYINHYWVSQNSMDKLNSLF